MRGKMTQNDKSLRIVFLGLPGAGKGTQAKTFSDLKQIPHISTGDMLRAAVASGTTLGDRVKDVMDSGSLVSDELMIEIIEARVSKADCEAGYILDGFPRTVPQAKALDAMLEGRGESLRGVVFFDLSEEEALRRLAIRRESESRVDDNEETQRKRVQIYREQTAPLIDHYQSLGLLLHVNAEASIDEVQARLANTLL